MPDQPLTVVDHGSGWPEGVAPDEIRRELGALIDGPVRFDLHDRMLYATDASIYQVPPIGVVIPESIDEAAAVIEYCAGRGLPILPRGAGTALAGQTVNAAIVIDFSAHCHRILDVDAKGRTARIEPGVVLDQLNGALAASGLMFGPDVATSTHANLGGMIGNNSAGARSIRYGRTVEHVVALDVMLADATRLTLEEGAARRDDQVASLTAQVAEIVLEHQHEIDAHFPKTLRHVDGYNLDLMLDQIRRSTPGTQDRVNLAQLFCGSEGTLGVTLGATLRLVETPRCKGLSIIAFRDVDEALERVGVILETKPSAVELIDDMIIRIAGENTEYRRYVELLPRVDGRIPGAILYVEHFAESQGELRDRFDALETQFAAHECRHLSEAGAMEQAWKLRKAGEPLLHGLPGLRKPLTFIEDTAVDPARLPEFIRSFRAIVERHGSRAAYFAHASVGCMHIRPLLNPRDPGDRERMQCMAREVTDLVKEYGGALSGEHGDGRLRSHLLERFYGPELCAAFRAVKTVFDPDNRLNPGNLVDPLPMDRHLRVLPHDRVVTIPEVDTYFRYADEEGFAGAIDMCNGAGMCRKNTGGVMCPSYRATRDERHATRGRGNALRLAVTGQFSADGRTPAWTDAETMATLDLCLSCKACKTECPSNVDIARLKSEYLAQGYRAGAPASLRTRVLGNIRKVNRLGSRTRGLANALNRFPPFRGMLNGLLDLDPRRSLPTFRPSLRTWFEARTPRLPQGDGPVVVLFPDCFSVYLEPQIGKAAVGVLETLGYRVVMPVTGCCGRSQLSLGLLDEARVACGTTARNLMHGVDRHDAVAVVGCEPSCISAIKDDWLELKMEVEEQDLRRLARATHSIEEFIEDRWDEHPAGVTMAAPAESMRPVVLHGHCHQKALWGMDGSTSLLRRVVGDRLRVPDSGCCGMAGSFGMTKGHYELSMKIFEQSLGDALARHDDAEILAPGTSCRHQIRDATRREATHPIEFLARALGVGEI